MSSGNYYIKEYIRRFINFSTSGEVASRGRLLYENDKVFFNEYIEKTDSWRFTVIGSQKYQVLIKGVNSQSIQTSCTCPFDWGSNCKHSVSALLFIADNLGNQSLLQQKQLTLNMPANNRYGKNNGFEIVRYELIDLEFIRKNSNSFILSQLAYTRKDENYNTVEITNESAVFKSASLGGEVKFYKVDGKVFVTSPQSAYSDKLTFSEVQCLSIIARSPMPFFLRDVFNGRILDLQKDLMKNFGLPESAVFDEYFSYAFTLRGGLKYYPSKRGEGLVPITINNDNHIVDYLRKLNNSELFLDRLPKKTEQREIGFVLTKGFREFNDFRNEYEGFIEDDEYDAEEGEEYEEYNVNGKNEQYRIIPIVGKPPKNNPSTFASHISEYESGMDDRFIISKSENTEKLLRLIDTINERKGAGFHLMREAFECLLQEKFVFGLKKKAKKIRKKDLVEITLAPEPYDVVFEVSKMEEFLTLELKRKTDKAVRKRTVLVSSPEDNYFYITGNTWYFAKSEKVTQAMAGFPETMKMVATFKDEFFINVVEPVSRNFEVRFKKGTFETESIELDFHKKQLFVSERDEYVVFTPCVEYENNVSAMLNTTGNILVRNGDAITTYLRNFELENDFLESLAELHPDFESQKSRKLFYLHYSDFTKNMWFYKFFDQLQALNVELFGLRELKNFKYSQYKGKISTTVSSGLDWFEVDIAVSFGDNRVTLSDIRKAVINKQRYIQLKDGSVGILPAEWFHKLEKFFRNGEVKNNKLEISKLRFSVVDELFDNLDDNGILQEIAEKRERLKSFTQIAETKVPKQIKATLRHYQKEGLNWLNFLDEMQWGGILADDMGLGKTLQVLAFLQLQVNQNRGVNLVVVPTTLLFNWKNELSKFAPKLKALYYYGNDREKSSVDFTNYDLVITTYGILVRDIQILSKYRFNYAVLDESQAIKNPASHRYKAACLIDARNKITLTGTPIENSTFDLFAQMSYANRGFFGGVQKFKENYSNPIDKDGNEVIAGELNKIIHPFVLRRTKEKVASELPDKTEDIIYCEMEPAQRRVYDAYRNEYRNRLLNKIEEDGMEKSTMMVLEALTRLRQICDSPVLLNSDDVVENQSVKINELMRHITLKTGKHKILVFSQFVKMLGLIRDELAKLNIEYEYLDGQSTSKQREQSVNHFQDNENLRVFLISLKAGGTGLNLTAADYVYIVDPWWNPAVENQAIDRCHRIGQDKKVFAYRMICTNTVEEKIIMLQNKKKKIAGDIIQTDESILKKLDKNDISELFT
jgi:SNF2 family DNA or RNA helicase